MIDKLLQFYKTEPVINRIKNNRYPILIYGAGTMALDVLDILEDNGIPVSGIVVDDAYYPSDDKLKGYTVIPFSKMGDKYDEYSVVLGRADYLKASAIKDYPNVKDVFYIANPCYKMTEQITADDLKEHYDAYNSTYELLSDELSKSVFISWINARINDDASYMFPFFSGELSYFDNDVFRVSEDSTFIDIGAYTGDTAIEFREYSTGHIWAFEADKANYGILCDTVKLKEITDIDTYNVALWSKHSKSDFGNRCEDNRDTGYVKSDMNIGDTELYTLDELLCSRIKKAGLLKINFPGADEVLKGAVSVIGEDKPKLAVRVGFDKYEVGTVPVWLHKNFSDYKIYMRYNMCIPAGLCMYAVPSAEVSD